MATSRGGEMSNAMLFFLGVVAAVVVVSLAKVSSEADRQTWRRRAQRLWRRMAGQDGSSSAPARRGR
jgi:hypothetical protein